MADSDPNSVIGVSITPDTARVERLTEIKGQYEVDYDMTQLLREFRCNPTNRHIEGYLKTIGALEKIQQIIDAS